MVGGLAAVLDLAQGDGGVGGRFAEHLTEEVRRHKVGAGAGGQIAAAGQELHGFEIDLFVAPVGVFHGGPALGEGRGV